MILKDRKSSQLPIVLCEWDDAWVDGTESVSITDVPLNHKASVQQTLGWLLLENESGISIANEYCPEDKTYRGRTYIPKGMIRSVTPFHLVKPRKPSVSRHPSPIPASDK